MNRLCEIAGMSRFRLGRPSQETDMDLRSEMQKIALQWPAYGYRRLHRELLRRGWVVNHKRVLRLMRMKEEQWHESGDAAVGRARERSPLLGNFCANFSKKMSAR